MENSVLIADFESANSSQAVSLTACCPLCAQPGAPRLFITRDRVHHTPGTFAIHRCSYCDAHFIQPWLDNDQLTQYYPAAYRRHGPAKSLDKKNYRGYWHRLVLECCYDYPATSSVGTASNIKRTAAWVLSWFMARQVIPYKGQGRILDVGCGAGSYLYRLKQWGWKTYGIEPSPAAAQQARALGLDVQQGTLRDAKYPDSYFDVVRLSNVLEHLPNPREVFAQIRRILKPDGIVYVTVPNTHSLIFWLFREHWFALDAPRHVISYSPKTLRVLCDASGFDIAAMNFSAGPFNCVRSLRYFLNEHENWPVWIRRIRWDHSKLLRRLLRPIFVIVDSCGYGDFLHATLRPK
ncbi:MAG: class I SAM-dependent methyltransferase [Deltaproteobacteria bacterium]|nr:class I SAM-dependent methyltransferase [Deltaproteobacteria bacterium]